MKYAAALAAGALAMTACSDDYLETEPSNTVLDETLSNDVEYYGTYINGINLLMMYQQGAYGQGYCGMIDVLVDIGNTCGNDWSNEALGGFNSANMKLTTANNAAYAGYAWWFLYQIIGQANRIISHIDEAAGSDESRAFYKAQALTYRAYCYQYLVQIFGNRWSDSNNGATNAVVLRVNDSREDLGLSTLANCYAQIYQDCDDAIALFGQSGRSATNFFDPSINLAYGVKARAALCREDWTTAAECAEKARAGHPLMSAREFQSGFHTANDEWIFGAYAGSEMNMWYYSFGCYYAYNGYYSAASGYNTLGSRQLVDALNDTDARKQLFASESMLQKIDPSIDVDALLESGDIMNYCWANDQTQEGVALAHAIYDYMDSVPGVLAASNLTGAYPARPAVYSQLKFGCTELPGVSQMVLMRSAEMYLTQAEALCKKPNPDYAAAQQLLYDVNSRMDPSYTKSTKTGQALIDEILFYRRAELWGEGFDWFDLKRTGASISRKSYRLGQGGVFGINFAVTVGPNDPGTNDWKWTIPLDETQYNSEVE